jgi:hypothetical protein
MSIFHFDFLALQSFYPVAMAREILAVPASTVASESAFSIGSRVLLDFQSRMT